MGRIVSGFSEVPKAPNCVLPVSRDVNTFVSYIYLTTWHSGVERWVAGEMRGMIRQFERSNTTDCQS